MSFPSWLSREKPESVNYPLENLPFGVFSYAQTGPRPGVALGDHVIDLSVLQDRGYLTGSILSKEACFSQCTLNSFMGLGKAAWNEARSNLTRLFDSQEGAIRDNQALQEQVLIPMDSVQMHIPATIGDFTDFFACKDHATNVGSLFRSPTNPLTPNWVHLPVAYHGRSSSVVMSGTDIHRPHGQTKLPDADHPTFGPSLKVDYELEMGLFIGPGNALGEPISADNAMNHAFGLVLLNDWSARDIQQWESVPLGPFASKNWASSISPWIVPMEALEPFSFDFPVQDPQPFPYLSSAKHRTYDITLEAYVQSSTVAEPELLTRSNLKHAYWTFPQLISHHTITGCNLQPGDLLGTGTISTSSTPNGLGCMLEMSKDQPNRGYLKDGDTITLTGWCEGTNGVRIGFGKCEGKILPPKQLNL